MFSKKERRNDIGTILIGFAVLMFGMDMMSGAVKPLADVPEFTSLLTLFSNPILGMLVGTGVTAVFSLLPHQSVSCRHCVLLER